MKREPSHVTGRYFATLLALFIVAAINTCLAQVRCPGDTIGDLSKAPEISFVGIHPGASTINGSANNVNAQKIRVVLWALTNIWYVQPYIASPYTNICSDGSWSNYTHSWSSIVALLVDSTYVPGSMRYTHPALDPGVVGWTEYPPVRPDMPIEFSGYSWGPKLAEDKFDPGPNYFSADTSNIWVNANGLHLRILYRNGKWTCSEVYLLQSLDYGIYTFQTTSRIDSLDPQSVFAMFLYESTSREIDIEFSKALANPHNAQYVVQPYTTSGNIIRFTMSPFARTSHRIEWRTDHITFTSWKGFSPNPIIDSIIYNWNYTGADIPPPGNERLHFNLWLFGGNPPQSGIGDEVVIRSFGYSQEPLGVDDQEAIRIPLHFALKQNYPNPFNPTTSISFSLLTRSFVSLKVFDLIGREVSTIISEQMSAGSYSRTWNAAGMPSGVYFYRLQAGSFTETKKLILMR